MTLGPREVRQLLSSHQLEPRRSRGQHFVADANTVRRIARLAGVGPGDRVVEVGAGLGSLTLALAETGARVVAVEVDHRLVPVLRSVVESKGAQVVEGDAMRLDWDELLGPERPLGAGSTGPERPLGAGSTGPERPFGAGSTGSESQPVDPDPWHLVANLPYNVATPLVADILDGVPAITRMLVMVQREVGERLAAGVGDPAYGAVSVKVGYWATASVVGRVPATVFVPPPKVESALVRITRRDTPGVGEEVDWDALDRTWLFQLVAAGFGQRRKMLRRSLVALVPSEAFACAGIRPEARAEELDVEAWGRLAECTPPPADPATRKRPGGAGSTGRRQS